MCVPVMGSYYGCGFRQVHNFAFWQRGGNVVFVDFQAGEFVGDSVIVKLAYIYIYVCENTALLS